MGAPDIPVLITMPGIEQVFLVFVKEWTKINVIIYTKPSSGCRWKYKPSITFQNWPQAAYSTAFLPSAGHQRTLQQQNCNGPWEKRSQPPGWYKWPRDLVWPTCEPSCQVRPLESFLENRHLFSLCPFPASNLETLAEVKQQSSIHKVMSVPQEARVPDGFVELLFQSQNIYTSRLLIIKKKLHTFSFGRCIG